MDKFLLIFLMFSGFYTLIKGVGAVSRGQEGTYYLIIGSYGVLVLIFSLIAILRLLFFVNANLIADISLVTFLMLIGSYSLTKCFGAVSRGQEDTHYLIIGSYGTLVLIFSLIAILRLLFFVNANLIVDISLVTFSMLIGAYIIIQGIRADNMPVGFFGALVIMFCLISILGLLIFK